MGDAMVLRTFGFAFLLSLTACSSLPRELQSALEAFPQLSVNEVGDTVVVQGEVNDAETSAAIAALLSDLTSVNQNGKTFVNRIELTPQARARQADLIQRRIGVESISAHFVGNSLFLEGKSPNDYEADRAVEIARSMLMIRASRSPSSIEPRIVDLLRVAPKKK